MTYYHVWFSPKNRKAVLEGDLGSEARTALLDVASTNGIRLLEREIGYDHVHLLINVMEVETLSSVMHRLKGASAHRVFEEYPELKLDLGHTAFWQRGGSRKLDPSELPRVRRYIRNHREEGSRGFLTRGVRNATSKPRVFNPRGS